MNILLKIALVILLELAGLALFGWVINSLIPIFGAVFILGWWVGATVEFFRDKEPAK